jgi:hypothetical protein
VLSVLLVTFRATRARTYVQIARTRLHARLAWLGICVVLAMLLASPGFADAPTPAAPRESAAPRPLTSSEFAWLDTFLRSNLKFADTAMNGKDAKPLTLKLEKAYAFPLRALDVDVFATCHAPGLFALFRSATATYVLNEDYTLEKVIDRPSLPSQTSVIPRIACTPNGDIVIDDDGYEVLSAGKPLRRTTVMQRTLSGGWSIAEETMSPFTSGRMPLMPDGHLYLDVVVANALQSSVVIPVDYKRLGLDPDKVFAIRVNPNVFVSTWWEEPQAFMAEIDPQFKEVTAIRKLKRVLAVHGCGSTIRIVHGVSSVEWGHIDGISIYHPTSPMGLLLARAPFLNWVEMMAGGGGGREWAVERIGDLCVRADTRWSTKHNRWFTTRLRVPDATRRVTDIRALGNIATSPLIKIHPREWPFGIVLFDSRAKRLIGRYQVSPTETYIYVLNYDAR